MTEKEIIEELYEYIFILRNKLNTLKDYTETLEKMIENYRKEKQERE